MTDRVADLLRFLDRSPTPYHAVEECVRRLHSAGFRALDEREVWRLEPGALHYVVRGQSSLAAFQVGGGSPAESGFRIIGAHTDSPNLRLKPSPDVTSHGCRQLAVEPYGGVLLHTWLDRDLSLAGRVAYEADGALTTGLVDFERPILRVPNLAIHLNRDVNREGLKLNAQQHMVPLVGLEDTPALDELLASELRARGVSGLSASDIRSYELMAYDTQPACVAGARGEFLLSARLDNLASCHAGLSALLESTNGPLPGFTRALIFYDHEEVGSRSAQGAGGTFLQDILERTAEAVKEGERQALSRAAARSFLISADMAHAVHPNYADRHEPGHRPTLGAGPVIKSNANQAYATDTETAGFFASLCQQAGVTPQNFVTRSDLGCGSTIGPISAARVGIRTVDVGNPMLSMHSCREMAATADVGPMIDVLAHFFTSTP